MDLKKSNCTTSSVLIGLFFNEKNPKRWIIFSSQILTDPHRSSQILTDPHRVITKITKIPLLNVRGLIFCRTFFIIYCNQGGGGGITLRKIHNLASSLEAIFLHVNFKICIVVHGFFWAKVRAHACFFTV